MCKRIISISKMAAAQILMGCVEAYAIRHHYGQKRSGLETFASLWGTVDEEEDEDKFINIKFVSFDTSADRDHQSVIASKETLMLKYDICSTLFGKYRYLGDLHTHPWLREGQKETITPKKVRDNKLYQLSKADYMGVMDHPMFNFSFGHEISLVMTILNTKKRDTQRDGVLSLSSNKFDFPPEDDALEFSLANLKLWLYGVGFDYIESEYVDSDDYLALYQSKCGDQEFPPEDQQYLVFPNHDVEINARSFEDANIEEDFSDEYFARFKGKLSLKRF